MEQRIGFARRDITPPLGTELGGYAGFRPCSGVHDPLFCRAVVLIQDGVRYALVSLDLVSADEALCARIAGAVEKLGIDKDHLLVTAIHTHAAPWGILPGDGPLGAVNRGFTPKKEDFPQYMEQVIRAAYESCQAAVQDPESFTLKACRGAAPSIGSERHTGADPRGQLTALEVRTQGGKRLIVYSFPCHPTVLNGENTLVSADFLSGMEEKLEADLAVFLNGAAGDISTRFTRRESSFRECDRMGTLAAERIRQLLRHSREVPPEPLRGIRDSISLRPRQVLPLSQAETALAQAAQAYRQAQADGMEPGQLRLLKTQVEGAWVEAEFSRAVEGLSTLSLPVTVFRFGGFIFATVPGELFSTLVPPGITPICYANGYYRYLADRTAYDRHDYESMAALVSRGQGEALMEHITRLAQRLE